MKKNVLLTSAMAFACAGAFAQSADMQANKMVKFDLQKNLKCLSLTAVQDGKVAKAPMRSSVDGVRYTRPEGSFWQGLTTEGAGYSNSVAVVPAYRNVVFKNVSTVTGTKWFSQSQSGLVDASKYADEDNNLLTSYPANFQTGSYWYAPVLASADNKTQFTLGEWNKNGGGIVTAQVTDMGTVDHNDQAYMFNQAPYGFGDNEYLIGTGEWGAMKAGGTAGYYLSGLLNFYPAPMASLYVENVHILVGSSVAAPMKDGQTITLTFYGVTGEGDNAQVDVNNVIGKMTATLSDYTQLASNSSSFTTTGEVYLGNLTFTAKGTDNFGNPTTQPIVLNQPYCVVMSGLNQEGIDMCFQGYDENTEDVESDRTYLVLYNPTTGDSKTHSYQNPIKISYNFTAGFDYIEPLDVATFSDGSEAKDFNVLKVSADGQTVTNAAYEQADYAVIYTAFEWYDEYQTEMYEVAKPDWITSYTVEASSNNDGEYYIKPVCEPLPDGVKGRAAKIYMSGRGYSSNTPLYVIQGDATKDDAVSGINGVENVKVASNSRTYNLSGQLVDKDFKGIVVRDGKKFFKK